MNTPFFDVKKTEDGWQAIFAFQVFHRQPEEWLKMRWGFNASVLLEEALDRTKLFVESQSISEAEFRSAIQPSRILALRGINRPGTGVQMSLLAKTSTEDREQAEQTALNYARELYSIFPQDFILIPAETRDDYHRLSGKDLLNNQAGIAQIQRGMVPVPVIADQHFLHGFWQASARSNEQIWRALSNMPQCAMFNVIIQPTFFYEGERRSLLELKKQISTIEQINEPTSTRIPWIETIIKRRLAIWKKFFIVQVHVIVEGEVDENLVRSIGSSLTRDANDQPLPGFQILWPDSLDPGCSWSENISSMDFVPASRMEDLSDSDEAFAVFRFPFVSEAGLPGANFITYSQGSPP